MPTYDVKIGNNAAKLIVAGNAFTYTREDGESIAREFSMEPAGDGTYSVLIEGRGYFVTLPPAARAPFAASREVMVNGRTLTVEVQDPRKLRGRGSSASGSGRQTIAAPMPGRVIRILVEAGQDVEAGDGLIVVEAMKMQNEMKSPKAGKILEVKTATGAAVSAGDVLLVIE
jgi:biotin carboxyl carrier protein